MQVRLRGDESVYPLPGLKPSKCQPVDAANQMIFVEYSSLLAAGENGSYQVSFPACRRRNLERPLSYKGASKMDQVTEFSDAQEQRLHLYHRRQLASLFRKDATEASVAEALSIAQDARLPRVALEFRVAEYGCVSGRWPFKKGVGAAIENYMASLQKMEMVRFKNSSFKGLTEDHHKAFEAVVSSARVLEDLEWPVNWEQNVQAILEPTEYGLRDGKLVHRFENLPEFITLGDEMLLLGTLTFYRQTRSNHGDPMPFKAVLMSAANSSRYGNIELHLRRHDDQIRDRFRYCSDWIASAFGRWQRVAI